MGFVLIFLLIYFIVRVIAIYKKDIGLFFNKFAKGILTWSQSSQMNSMLIELEALGFYKHTHHQLANELKKSQSKQAISFGMKLGGSICLMRRI